MNTRISGAWYALCAIPPALGVVFAVLTFLGMIDDIEAMPRLAVPGERTVALDAGEHIVFGERESIVDGKAYATGAFSARCSLVDAETGEPLRLETKSSKTTYDFGSYSGQSMFEVDVPRDGTYRLACDGGPGVVAIGHGIGLAIFLAIGGGFVGLGLGVVVFFLVRRVRMRHNRGNAPR